MKTFINAIQISRTWSCSMNIFTATHERVGASHQTGWTGAVAELINRISRFHPTYEEKESELEERNNITELTMTS